MRAVDYLRKHERIKLGSVKEIVDSDEYDKDPFLTIPRTPQELFTKDKTKEELPWYWREDYDNTVPRTPPYEIRQRPSSSSKGNDETPNEEPTGGEGPQTKRAKTQPKDSDEETQRRLQEWRDAAAADRKSAELWVPFEDTEEGHRQADEAYKKRIQWKKWFETNQEALMRIEWETAVKKEEDELKAEALKWKTSA